MVDILEVIRKQQLRSAKASISFGESQDRIVSSRAAEVKECLREVKTGQPVALSETRMASMYYRMLDEYERSPRVRMASQTNKRGLALWKRVVKACNSSGVDPETYLKSQFAYFRKHFGTYPKVYQLATEQAIERAVAFSGDSSKRVIATSKPNRTDIASVMRTAENQMQAICRAQKISREEVYRNLVIPGIITFPSVYLKSDPVYQKVKSE